jgi:hypothetical protein
MSQSTTDAVIISFRIGAGNIVETYSIDNPLPSWRLVDGVPSCSTCGKPIFLLGQSTKKRNGDVWVQPKYRERLAQSRGASQRRRLRGY